jgi:hypothetical protein
VNVILQREAAHQAAQTVHLAALHRQVAQTPAVHQAVHQAAAHRLIHHHLSQAILIPAKTSTKTDQI